MYLVFQLTIDDPCNQRPSSGYRHRERALSESPLGGDFRHFSVISVKHYPSLKPYKIHLAILKRLDQKMDIFSHT